MNGHVEDSDSDDEDEGALATPIIMGGMVFPTMISNGCKGDTNNCSNVPNSRSLATERPVRIRASSVVMVPTKQRTVNQR